MVGGIGLERPGGLELVAGELQHPGRRRRAAPLQRSASSTGGPMLPATSRRRPPRAADAPVSAVTVLLPLVPVIARTLAPCRSCHGEELDVAHDRDPRSQRFCTSGSLSGRPGLMQTRSTPSSSACVERAGACSSPAKVACARGGARARVGDARRCRPRARPSAPPTVRCRPGPAPARACLAASGCAGVWKQEREGRLAHHLSFSVERPNSTSIMVMIQKRTTTWLSFQPFELVVVVQRRHAEDALAAGALEVDAPGSSPTASRRRTRRP